MVVQRESEGKSTTPVNNIAGALAYVTLLPALLFLGLRSYRTDSFVRFHSLQCLLCWIVGAAAAAVLRLFGIVVSFLPVGPLLTLLFVVIVVLAAVLTWVVLLIKAFQGEKFALPIIGAIAEQYSGAD